MKIPNSAIPKCYYYSKAAFKGKITSTEARKKIHETLGINFGSARDYYLYYNYLMTGIKPTWSLNKFTTEYFLKSILEDKNNSSEQKKNTLENFKKLIVKLEGEKVGSKKSMRNIYQNYSKFV